MGGAAFQQVRQAGGQITGQQGARSGVSLQAGCQYFDRCAQQQHRAAGFNQGPVLRVYQRPTAQRNDAPGLFQQYPLQLIPFQSPETSLALAGEKFLDGLAAAGLDF